jgi:hypothetical protein
MERCTRCICSVIMTDDEQNKEQLHHQEFLFLSLFSKIAKCASRLVVEIREAYLPVRPGKTPIKDCTGTTRKTLGTRDNALR